MPVWLPCYQNACIIPHPCLCARLCVRLYTYEKPFYCCRCVAYDVYVYVYVYVYDVWCLVAVLALSMCCGCRAFHVLRLHAIHHTLPMRTHVFEVSCLISCMVSCLMSHGAPNAMCAFTGTTGLVGH